MATLPVRAVYAPIPEQEQGKDFTLSLRTGVAHDSNIFGAATDAIDSTVWTLAPRALYNVSLTAQTFLAASYGLTLDRFDQRPGDKLLDSHDATLRVAHAFSKVTTIDVNDAFMVARNPESLLAGVPVNTDQSFTRNQIDGRFVTPVTAKLGATLKARSVYYDYRNRSLGRSIDRLENLYGVAGDYAILPELRAVAEYRHLDVFYRTLGEEKNKSSEYLMAGFDYGLAKKMSVSGRLGGEWRRRSDERNTQSPYVEFSAKYDYTEKSFFTGGYAYTLEESSDTARFTDTKVHRLFGNVQHALTALIVASGSVTYEPTTLQGRRGFMSVAETTTRTGVALSYLPTKNWSASVSYDRDNVRSEDPSRRLRRARVALGATFTF